MTTAISRPARETRIDLIRGLALATIYINHVPGTAYEGWTSRNFGFSDAAEAFVLISGLSAALAYGRWFAPGADVRVGLWRSWGRAWTLYLVHIAISVMALGLVAGVLRFAQIPDMLNQDNFQALSRDPVGVFIGLPLLLHQFGYINILSLYVLLMLAAPGMLWIGRRHLWLLVALSAALWLYAGLTRLNLPNYPNRGGWFLNPFSWQLVFVIGMAIGIRLSEGRRLVPKSAWLTALAAGYVILAALWVQIPAVREAGNQVMVWFSQAGAPRLFTNFNKSFVEAPRLLHVISLAYVVSVLPGLARFSASRWAEPLSVMGRQALPVFAAGTVLSFAARAVLTIHGGDSPALEFAVIWGGLAILIAFALTKQAVGRITKAPRAG